MRNWALGATDPRALRLAADALAGPTDYVNDQIWDLHLGGGRPPAMAVETTYGRRARSLRVYAGFATDGPIVADPSQFAAAPVVERFLPSWLRVRFSPFEGLDVEAEYWVPDSHAIAGRYRLTNATPRFQAVRLALFGVLDASADGRPMAPETRGGAVVLSGRTKGLYPVVFLTGGAAPEAGATPGLALTVDVGPRAARPVVWVCAAEGGVEDSFEAARAIAARSWDPEIARLERIHSRWVEVETGEPDWDAALAWGQKAALGSFVGPTPHMASPSIVSTRTPDEGSSAAGDGSDYGPDWSGADVATAEYVASQVLYAAPELAQGVIGNFLSTATSRGALDGRPGPGGQRAKWLCPPRLAALTWKIYHHTHDLEFLRSSFPALVKFFGCWFDQDRDPGGTGLPSWEHGLQADAEERPALAAASGWGEGLDPREVIAPDLLAALVLEADALLRMADVLGAPLDRAEVGARRESLRGSLAAAWSPSMATFQYLDRETRRASTGTLLAESRGSFRARPRRSFDPPARISIRVDSSEGRARGVQVALDGKGPRGRSRQDRFGVRRFRWLWDCGVATSEGVFSKLEAVQVEGLPPDARVVVRAAGLDRQDLNLLIPLATNVLDAEAVTTVVQKTLMNPERYGRPSGWPSVPADDPAYAPGTAGGPWVVNLPLQARIGEALARAGHAGEVFGWLERTMSCLVQVLKTEGAFREAYHPEMAQGWGKRDHVLGVTPLSLFLAVAGVSLLSPHRVELTGGHVFPWPLTIRWRGLSITRSAEGTRVVFPDGSETTLERGVEGLIEQVAADG